MLHACDWVYTCSALVAAYVQFRSGPVHSSPAVSYSACSFKNQILAVIDTNTNLTALQHHLLVVGCPMDL